MVLFMVFRLPSNKESHKYFKRTWFMAFFNFYCIDLETSKISNRCSTVYCIAHGLLFLVWSTLDVLWGQPIKLAQVASTSEWLENQRNNLAFFKIIPSHFCRASEASKIMYEKFGPKFLTKILDILVP